MAKSLPAKEFLQTKSELLLDVRSPAEYEQGHIPGATSFPLFSDQERARVGTTYKQEGPHEALVLGLELVGPKLAHFVREARRLNPRTKAIRVYCFRGGQRSQSMAWLLEKGGFQVELLTGGYKAYRREVLRSFTEPQDILVLSGYTGSGKTRVLQALEQQGEQIIDLEGLACHRGSAFGGYHQPEDLTTEMFQNLLHEVWSGLDRRRRVWVEDEGRTLGRLLIPDDFWAQMRQAPVLFLDIDQKHRIKFLVDEYGDYDRELLRGSVNRIRKRLGGLTHRHCLEALEAGQYGEVVRLCLNYYDRAYLHCVEKRKPELMWKLSLDAVEIEQNVKTLLSFIARVSRSEVGVS